MNYKILLMAIVLILIIPTANAANFDSWKDAYYNPNDSTGLNDLFDNLTADELTKSDFFSLEKIYEKVYANKSSKIIKIDFKRADNNGNGKLSYKEFKNVFNPVYQFYR